MGIRNGVRRLRESFFSGKPPKREQPPKLPSAKWHQAVLAVDTANRKKNSLPEKIRHQTKAPQQQLWLLDEQLKPIDYANHTPQQLHFLEVPLPTKKTNGQAARQADSARKIRYAQESRALQALKRGKFIRGITMQGVIIPSPAFEQKIDTILARLNHKLHEIETAQRNPNSSAALTRQLVEKEFSLKSHRQMFAKLIQGKLQVADAEDFLAAYKTYRTK